jgi:hypothetical protein
MTPLIRGAFHLQRQLKLLFKQIRRFGSVNWNANLRLSVGLVNAMSNEHRSLLAIQSRIAGMPSSLPTFESHFHQIHNEIQHPFTAI